MDRWLGAVTEGQQEGPGFRVGVQNPKPVQHLNDSPLALVVLPMSGPGVPLESISWTSQAGSSLRSPLARTFQKFPKRAAVYDDMMA